MRILDKAKEMFSGHEDQARKGVDKTAQKANEMTGHKKSDKINKGAGKVEERIESMDEDREQ